MCTKELNHFLMAYLFRNSLKMEMAFVVTLHEDNTLRRQANKTQQSVSTEDSAVMQGSHNTLCQLKFCQLLHTVPKIFVCIGFCR